MSTGVPDKAISRTDIDEAIKALLAKIDINHRFWIPYLGGYSKDWSSHPCVYINASFPDKLMVNGKLMQPYRYLLIHESVEKCLMDELNLPYSVAHTFATGAENAAVIADGFSWADYTDALKKPIQEARKDSLKLPAPKDLDERPYQESHDDILSKAANPR